jgi:D-arabinose 1-dehydrogenase-like Zn-dependent alcohol dehydrogenase
MGTRTELAELLQFMATAGISPHIDSIFPLADARDGFAKMNAGDVFGKIVFTV